MQIFLAGQLENFTLRPECNICMQANLQFLPPGQQAGFAFRPECKICTLAVGLFFNFLTFANPSIRLFFDLS